jgi:hypothetical protein
MMPICWAINAAKLNNEVHKICKSMQGTFLRVINKICEYFPAYSKRFFFAHNVTVCGYQVVIKYQKID